MSTKETIANRLPACQSPSHVWKGRALSLLISLILLPLCASAQQLGDHAARLEKFGKAVPQEEVFLHMDNTCYFLGDTIFYKAYVTRGDNHLPTQVSRVLYVELLNNDGYLVERQILRLKDGQAHGSFCLADTLYAGYHELRAYTRWQLNWGQHEHPHSTYAKQWFLTPDLAEEYFRDYDKLYSRVFPVYDKPMAPGEYLRDMSLRPLRRTYTEKEAKQKAIVTFYPEGGNWVKGIGQQLAFEANDADGEHLDGTLVVYDSQKNKVAEARTEHRGRGVISLTQTEGKALRAEFQWGDALSSKVDLPKAVEAGAVMQVSAQTTKGEALKVRIATSGLTADSLGLCVSCKGVLKHYEAFVPSAATELTIPTDQLPTGIAQLTLFDREGHLLADRLTFVQNSDITSHALTFTGMPEECPPYQKVSFTVSGQQKGTISLAVRDQTYSDYLYDDATFLTEQLLCSQIKGFVEHPNYYFEADDALHRHHLDLLLMVQGWRRYSWTDMTSKFTLRQPYEQHRILNGEVYKYESLDQEDYFSTTHQQIIEKVRGGSAGPVLEEALRFTTPIQKDEVTAGNKGTLGSIAPPVSGGSDADAGGSEDDEGSTPSDSDNVSEGVYQGRYLMMREMALCGPNTIYYYNKKNDPSENQYAKLVKDNVLLHAEFTQPNQEGVVGDMTVQDGKFNITAPDFDSYCFFFLTAAKERKKEKKDWISMAPEDLPEYYVRLSQFYPRFVKPYSHYHTQLAPVPESASKAMQQSRRVASFETDMRELSVRSKHRGLRGFNVSKPAYVTDAYEAVNSLYDAGLMPGCYMGFLSFSLQYARLLVGDMGISRSYDLERRWNDKDITHNLAYGTQTLYNHLENLDSVKVYTDYAPRREGDPRFEGSNQPLVTIDMVRYADNTVRPVWRDRQYILPGYNVCEEFYHPNYSKRPLPSTKDYRRTLYWTPNLQLDDQGQAEVTFYNNSRTTFPTVSAEGLTDKGEVLSTRKLKIED